METLGITTNNQYVDNQYVYWDGNSFCGTRSHWTIAGVEFVNNHYFNLEYYFNPKITMGLREEIKKIITKALPGLKEE